MHIAPIIPEGKICDYIDKTFRNDTPEEYVRQTIEKRLVNEHKYTRDRINVEFTIKLGSNKPRIDIGIFPENCTEFIQENIKIIVECKREAVEINNKKEGIEQLKSYMSACPNCEWGMWTNGKSKEVFRKVINNGHIIFEEYIDIPSAFGSIEDIDRPKRDTLKNAVVDNLLFTFKTCHNHIYITDGLQKQPAFFEFLKIIFCKIEDERNLPHPLQFYTTSAERSNPDGQLTVKKRISKIFEGVKKKYGKIFEANDVINLQPRSLAYIVSELQKYSLLNTNIDIKGKAYEELVGANLRGDRGEFFTPRNIMKMTVEMIAPKMHEKVLDSSCGTGGFLVTAMNYVIKQLDKELTVALGKSSSKWNYDEIKIYQEKISEIASSNFYGFDINPDLVKATKMNMVMNNDGSGNILRNDSLLPPHEWTEEFKTKLAEALQIDPSELRNSKSIGYFDVILTNPPFGSKIPIKDPHILEQFELGYIWVRQGKGWVKTNRLQSSVPPEQLFIERCWQLLKQGGRMGIVLPDSILGSPGLAYIRQWLIKNTIIISSIDLHVDTFQPRNGTQTSVLFLQKKTREEVDQEEKSGQMQDYNIFMAMVDKVGHDKRGNATFKRDAYGNEILIPESSLVDDMGENSEDENGGKSEAMIKLIDDQTDLVPNTFRKWKELEGITW
ncbi:restriction endonuclease subunit M [Paenibacillus psychroresistens]|uniref:Restriction endonuclease subunit M n=1 Tax=Paenibacillus psychroresistens TaxID=1778678 RepID=A0A6B8RYC0_9BACL|nr:restriction endonuclease subunit M [Paenibacillus psychroresistens]